LVTRGFNQENNMPSPESESDDVVEQTAEQAASPADFAPTESCAELLDEVLRQTRAAIDGGQPLEAAETQALLQVRRCHANESLVAEPVAAELVRVLLQARFPKLSASQELWEKMSHWIAETLLEDPDSRARLLQLWAQLSEMPP
jgi:hypothetical protein